MLGAELVDTCAEDVEGCVHLRVHLLLQGLGHFLVGGSALELAQELAFANKESRHCARLYVGRHARDEILLVASGAGCLRLADSLVYLFKLCVARCVLTQQVRYRYLKDHVHTALEVKAHSHFHLAYLAVGIAQVDLFLVDGVVKLFQALLVGIARLIAGLRHADCVFLRLFLVIARHNREAEIKSAYQNQQNSNGAYKPFVLHCLIVILYLFNLQLFINVNARHKHRSGMAGAII